MSDPLDEFTQRVVDSYCLICFEPAYGGDYCEKHEREALESQLEGWDGSD